MQPVDYASPGYRLSTRITFFVVGFVMAAWAPLVPYAKHRLGFEDAQFGTLLLCMGVGSIIGMPLAGRLAMRIGLRRLLQVCGFIFSFTLLGLATAANAYLLGALLFLFGACLGITDICVNLQASMVERAAARPLMSGFHGLFSVGTFTGAGGVTWILDSGLPLHEVALGAALLAIVLLVCAAPRQIACLDDSGSTAFERPRGIVWLLALLSFACLLVEGAMLDWSALYVHEIHQVDKAQSGIAYTLFTLAMAIARLTGDRLTHVWGDRLTFGGGLILSIIGYVMAQTMSVELALLGFALAGFGIANAIPILFRAGLSQTAMPGVTALSFVATIGYLGVLLGPAFIGYLSHAFTLQMAFWLLTLLLIGMAMSTPFSIKAHRRGTQS